MNLLRLAVPFAFCVFIYLSWVPVSLAQYSPVEKNPEIKQAAVESVIDPVVRTGNSDNSVVFKPVVVSATLSEKSLEETPGTVHLLSKDLIRMRDVRRIGDILQETPGVYVWGANQGSRAASANRANRISIRGVSGGARTLVMLDNQKMNDPSFGTINWANLFPEDIERIEVIPGAASALYGGNAFAGVIRVISKKPVKRELSLTGGYQFNTPEGGYGSAVYRDKFDNGLAI